MTDTTDVAWTVVVRIEDTDRWIDWSTGHRTVPDVLAAAELIVPVSTIAEIRFDRITTARKRFSLADLGATDAAAPSEPADRTAILREAADIAEQLMDDRYGPDCSYAIGGRAVARELRRMADEAQQPETQGEVVHACPPDGSGLTPCCGRTPFELPRTDRMSADPTLVTCQPAAVSQPGKEA